MGEDFFSKNILKEGRKLLDAGAVRGLQFSEGIYQFTVKLPKSKESFYPILQVDDKGGLIDALCECQKGSKERACGHLAASWLKVFDEQQLPLHMRFRNSLWHALFKIVGEKQGYSFTKAKKKGKEWSIDDFSLKALSPKTAEKIAELLQPSKKALESSLKFSSLSPEEHLVWRQGKASTDLAYRLSPWCNLAEWLFLRQLEKEKYEIQFSEQKEGLPKFLIIHFPDVEISVEIQEEDWLELIPKLSSVSSSLQTFSSQYAPILKSSYEEKERALQFHFASTPLLSKGRKKPIIPVGDWFFVPSLGFFPAHRDPLLGEKILKNGQIAEFLDRHLPIARTTLKIGIDPLPRQVKFTIKFLEKKGLEIEGYLFEPGDLKKPGCAQFDHWVYLPKQGFFKVISPIGRLRDMIPIDQISSFIAKHRLFLIEHEGFQIHLSTIESSLTYRVDENGNLRFDLSLEEGSEQEGVFDLGDWVYIRGRGFYPKTKQSGVLRAGLVVPSQDIASFIERHHQDLETIRGFFASRCPLEASGLNVFLNAEEKIVVSPSFQIAADYLVKQVKILGACTYVKGEGFAEIPDNMQLPAHFTQERVIPASREADFVMHQLEMLKPFLLKLDQRLSKPEKLVLKLLKFKRSSSAIPSWNLELVYESSFGKLPIRDIKEAILKNKSYLFSPAGLLMLDWPRFTWIKELASHALKKASSRITLTTIQCLKLAAFEEVVNEKGKRLKAEDWQALFEAGIKKQPPSLEGLKSVLRPYQAKGFEWLWALYLQGLSGLLCDEMGLGKTHQAMALIAALLNEKVEGVQKKFLVVCPTSVIFHWQELFRRFLPSAKTHVFHGTQRDYSKLKNDVEVVITSYGIVRSERKLFKKLTFSLAILDEIQVAKNLKSLTHRALKTIDAGMFLGLTGTPIENRLLDLKSLFDVILPKYLPNDFEALYGAESNWENDPKRKLFLKQLISPFLLRRKKSEVLSELPEKIEEIYYCTLSSEQEKLYREALKVDASTILSELKDESKPFSVVHIFALLNKLKQICNHPCLVLPKAENYFSHSSGKWDLFVELLNEAAESGQKVVVFSQFLKMLDIIEAYLDERGIGHAGIRGSTRDRQTEVHRFRDDPHCTVFVASLQAAGVGIDLVAASIVIHYDRWWNPAKENQATDRVHRIGQERGVQVFKLVSKNTIEEHIDRIIQRKTKLLKEAIGFDEQDVLKQFDRSELIELLQEGIKGL